MNRTTVLLPENLKRKVNIKASSLKISLGEYIRKSLEASLKVNFIDLSNDPFVDDRKIYTAYAEKDLSLKVDDYVYREKR